MKYNRWSMGYPQQTILANVTTGERITVMPLPYGFAHQPEPDVEGNMQPGLSVPSRMVMDAAALLVDDFPEARFVIAAEGLPAEAGPQPSAATLLANRAIQQGVNSSSITNLNKLLQPNTGHERSFNNTVSQVGALAAWAETQGEEREFSPTVIVALKYHLPRVRAHAEAYGLTNSNTHFITAEGILEWYGVRDYEKYHEGLESLGRAEKLLQLVTRLSPKGGLLKLLSRIRGVRLVDFIQDDHGRPQLVNSYARDTLVPALRQVQPKTH